MPTYEYECTECHGHFEYFQSMKEAPKKICETCGGELTKLLSVGSGLIFKGSGFYITDYKSKSSSNGSSGESKSEQKSDAKTEGKSEGKSEAKTESKPSTESGATKKD